MVYDNYFLLVPVPYLVSFKSTACIFFDVERESAKAKKDSWLEMSDDINQNIPIYSTGPVHI